MTYNTLNPVPSTDPRDLDDNAQAFDRFLMNATAAEPDRLGQMRKTWHQMEMDAAALVSPNVAALAAVTPAIDRAVFFNSSSPVGMGTYALTSFVRGLGSAATQAEFRTAIGALAVSDTGAYAGSAAKLTTPRNLVATGDASWAVSFDGSANVTAALTLSNTGVTAGTYGAVTVNAKGLVTAASAQTPIANGGTGAATAANARTNMGVLAQTDKPAWSAYTPTLTAAVNTFTSTSVTGKVLILFGIAYVQIRITVTTRGTGSVARVTLPNVALAGSAGMSLLAVETAVNGRTGSAQIESGLASLIVKDYNNGDLVSADGAIINISGCYPIA